MNRNEVLPNTMRSVDLLFARYSEFHRNRANKLIHWICVPSIVWSVLGMLWTASPVAAYAAIAAAMLFYLWLSVRLALGMFIVLAVMAWALTLLSPHVLIVSIAVFVAAWTGQFVGHALEGRRPAFVDDVRQFLVGPAWLLGDLYRKLGISY